jgi:hypothetical protein
MDRLPADFAKTQLGVEALRRRVGRLDIELAGDPRHRVAPRQRIDLAVEPAAGATRLRAAGHHDAIDIQEARIALRKPAVVRTVVVRAFAEREQERRDPAIVLDHPMQRRLRMQPRQPRIIERTQHGHEGLVERKDGREVGGRGVAQHSALIHPGPPVHAGHSAISVDKSVLPTSMPNWLNKVVAWPR